MGSHAPRCPPNHAKVVPVSSGLDAAARATVTRIGRRHLPAVPALTPPPLSQPLGRGETGSGKKALTPSPLSPKSGRGETGPRRLCRLPLPQWLGEGAGGEGLPAGNSAAGGRGVRLLESMGAASASSGFYSARYPTPGMVPPGHGVGKRPADRGAGGRPELLARAVGGVGAWWWNTGHRREGLCRE